MWWEFTSEKASSSIVDIEFSEKSRYLIPRTCIKVWLLMMLRLLWTIRNSLMSIPNSRKSSADKVACGIREIARKRRFLICRRSWREMMLFCFPLRSKLYKEYWKPLKTSAKILHIMNICFAHFMSAVHKEYSLGENVSIRFSRKMSVCRKSNSWNNRLGSVVMLFPEMSINSSVDSKPARLAELISSKSQSLKYSSRMRESRNVPSFKSRNSIHIC